MNLLEKMMGRFARPKAQEAGPQIQAATAKLPEPTDPKVKKGQATLPSFMTSAKPSTSSALPRTERNLVNTDLTTLRSQTTAAQTVRSFAKSSPDLSAAVTSYVRTAVTSGHRAIAYNRDGTPNPQATAALSQVINHFNVLSDYAAGYDSAPSLRSLAETWSLSILFDGAMAGELVLDKTFMPSKIQAISASQVRLYPSSDGKRLVPVQEIAGEKISLDVPTFFMVTLDQDTLDAYPLSPIEPALQSVLASAEFMNDIRRIVKRAIHPRMVVTIDEEKFRKFMPMDVMQDQEKAIAYMNSIVSDVESRINNLSPEDVLVFFDTMGIEVVDHGNTNLSNEYKVIQDMHNARMSTGAKVLPTVLGHSSGTSNVASAEVLMFVKYVEGAVHCKLNEMFSGIFTLATRLLGYDVYVDFAFNPIELRPESELESFRSMKQSRVLDLLSLGLMSDEQASIELTGRLPPAGYKPLSGTGFRASAQVTPAGAGYNGATNDGSTMNQNLKSPAPQGEKGGRGKQNSDKAAEVVPLHG